MVWDEIIGHEEAIRSLKAEAAAPSHAYLFTGPSGIGKAMVARAFAASLNCLNGEGCGDCLSCRKIAHGLHPDVHILEPAGKSEYLMGQIVRRPTSDGLVVVEEANRSPFEGRRKVFIFEEADRLSEETSNALLKTLEEPPGDTVFILLSSRVGSILPTIVSRCQIVHFFGVPEHDVVEYLTTRGVPSDEAVLAARLSGGLIGEASSFACSPTRKAARSLALSVIKRLPEAGAAEVSLIAGKLLDEAVKGVEELKEKHKIELKRAIDMAPAPHLAVQAKKTLEERHKRLIKQAEQKGIESIVSYLASWYRDALILAIGGREEMVANVDELENLNREAARSPKALMSCIEAFLKVRKIAGFNVNMQMALEEALFKVREELA